MRVATFTLIIISAVLMIESLAISDSMKDYLEMYEDFALATVWKNMVYMTWYQYLASFVCDTYATYLVGFLQSTLNVTEDTVKATIDAPTLCTTGFELMYRTVWYSKGVKVFYFGAENTELAYTPTG